ncbi:MAG TPA: HD-GYP domain-containing protein [Gemmatimonadaceae bacterium]|nr:HD-GYP domain-containing protein [Gemmatimonadaceae bacterium]
MLYQLAPISLAANPVILGELVVLAAIGVILDHTRVKLQGGANITISSMALGTAALLVPDWATALAVAVAATATQALARRSALKAIVNVNATALAIAVAIAVHRLTGGGSLLLFANKSPVVTLYAFWWRVPLFVVVSFLTSSFVVGIAIALATGSNVVDVWKANFRESPSVMLISIPALALCAGCAVYLGLPGAILVALIPAASIRRLVEQNKQLEIRQAELEEQRLALERTHKEVLQLIVLSIEARDPYTSGHSQRVQHNAMIFARGLGFDDMQVHKIGVAGVLHDVGKMGAQYAPILAKPSRLTPEERAILERHPVDGANLVATITELSDIVDVVRSHHENWDGSGYPDRLQGESIPLHARIIRIVDTIDAMTTLRPYRSALGEADVRAELIKYRGTQFDPTLVDALLQPHVWATIFPPVAPTTTREFTPRFGVRRITAEALKLSRG